MLHVLAPGPYQDIAQLVLSAWLRSGGQGSAALGSLGALADPAHALHVVIHPREEWTDALLALTRRPAKLLVLGRLSHGLATALGVQLPAEWPADWAGHTLCPPATTGGYAESVARVVYPANAPRIAGQAPAMAVRPFRRHDFADEWNNLGYGAITADGTPWSIAQNAQLPTAHELAAARLGDQPLCGYAGLWDLPGASVLWFNRAAGPVDSQEWRLVEDFFSCHRADTLPCTPVLAEVPHGFDSAVTMRLDCDEDVESARALWDLHRAEDLPFSLALHARVLADARHHALPREVLAGGGALLSHTATHAPDWGGSYDAAFHEGRQSANVIETHTGYRVRHAVSPFHQTPLYARLGLADAGYTGCIGGIIRNDPDFLTARAGIPPGSGQGFIGHSQQCMLHGDCLLSDGEPLRAFHEAFRLARVGGAFFGYLDHPFSERYAYGWRSEAERVEAHRRFIGHIRETGGRVLWANASDALDFLSDRAHTTVHALAQGHCITRPSATHRWPLAVRYRGQVVSVTTQETLA